MSKIALITGANKGIGFAAARGLAREGFHVFIAARDTQKAEEAALKIRSEGFDADFLTLDVADEESIRAAALDFTERWEGLDVLVNNAAINLDDGRGILDVPLSEWRQTFETNVLGVVAVTSAFWPLLMNSASPRVINVSSGAGRLYDMEHQMPSYSTSKTALNAVTRQFAGLDKKVSVNAICPGWVKTDMGGPEAPRTPEQGASIIVHLATTDNPPSGKYMNEDGEIGW